MADLEFVEKDDPGEVFAVLAEEIRIAILRALWAADDHEATFSELREAVGGPDSGRFNYHLDRLVGRFVERTEDGYELTQAGMQINGAIEAGAYTAEAAIEPIELEVPCRVCGGVRTLYYEDDTVSVECESCPVTAQFGVPPSVFAGYDRESVPDVAGRYMRVTFRRIADGFCPFCDGRVRPTVAPMADSLEETPADVPDEVADRATELPLVRYDCRRCGATPTGGLRLAFLDHPAVVSFYYRHGIDLRERSVWEFTGAHPDQQRIRSRDPFRASVTYELDGDAITLVVDESADVVDVEE